MEPLGIMTADFVIGADFSRFDSIDASLNITATACNQKVEEVQSDKQVAHGRKEVATAVREFPDGHAGKSTNIIPNSKDK